MMPPREERPAADGESTHASNENEGDGIHHDESSSLLPLSRPQEDRNSLVVLEESRRLLFFSHFFNQFSEGAWQFCLILFLAAFTNYNSLILVSSYGFVSNGAVFLFGASFGRFVDGANRLFAAQRFIISENLCVVLASLCCYILLGRAEDPSFGERSVGISSNRETTWGFGEWFAHRFDGVPLDPLSIVLLIAIHVLGACAMSLDKGFMVAVERDWIVVMSQHATMNLKSLSSSRNCQQQGQKENDNNDDVPGIHSASKEWLSATNVTMKQIDLSCKVVSPAVAGLMIATFDDGTDPHHGVHLRVAALAVGVVNVVALAVEYYCSAKIYYMLPALASKNRHNTNQTRRSAQATTVLIQSETLRASTIVSRLSGVCRLPQSTEIYLEQPIAKAGISLSLLYLNVLSFGGIMTGYLVWRGMGLDAIGIWRGVSSGVGLLGTVLYHFSVKKMSLIDTGMWSIFYQFCCLSICFLSLFIINNSLSLSLLILGVIASRIGLWVFDIAITQLMQIHIPDGIRGLVGGVQQSLNSFFFLLSFALGFVFPDPKDFHIYVSVGFGCVGIAMLLYTTTIYLKKSIFAGNH